MSNNLDLDILVEIGKFTNILKQEVKNLVVADGKASDVIDFIERSIFKNGYLPAFPCTICVNQVAAHFTIFEQDIIFKKGDVVKVDFGVSKDGNITDTAFTIEIQTEKYKEMIEANRKALDEQVELIECGTKMYQLGQIAQDRAKEVDKSTIQNLSGHQIEKNNLHAGLHVPNYNNGDSSSVSSGMLLAIEPYFSSGSSRVKNANDGNILHLIKKKPVRDAIAKKVLNHIGENYPSLPFSKRWLVDEIAEKLGIGKGFDKKKVLYAINLLKRYGIIYEHSILVSSDGSINSQFEDTVFFNDKEKIVITRL